MSKDKSMKDNIPVEIQQMALEIIHKFPQGPSQEVNYSLDDHHQLSIVTDENGSNFESRVTTAGEIYKLYPAMLKFREFKNLYNSESGIVIGPDFDQNLFIICSHPEEGIKFLSEVVGSPQVWPDYMIEDRKINWEHVSSFNDGAPTMSGYNVFFISHLVGALDAMSWLGYLQDQLSSEDFAKIFVFSSDQYK